MSIRFNLKMAEQLVALFGGDYEAEASVSYFTDAHSGPGAYFHFEDYPEDGCEFIGTLENSGILKEQEPTE